MTKAGKKLVKLHKLGGRFEHHHRQRRQRNREAVVVVVLRNRLRRHPAAVAHVCSAEHSASELRISRYPPGSGTPTRYFWRGSGVKLHTNSRKGMPFCGRRMKEIVEPSTSRKSTHSKPSQWKSLHRAPGASDTAGLAPHERLQFPVQIEMKQVPGQPASSFHSSHAPISQPMNSSFLPGCAYM